MKIKYEFVTGETVEVEVDDSIGKVMVELDRIEYNNDHKERPPVDPGGPLFEGIGYWECAVYQSIMIF